MRLVSRLQKCHPFIKTCIEDQNLRGIPVFKTLARVTAHLWDDDGSGDNDGDGDGEGDGDFWQRGQQQQWEQQQWQQQEQKRRKIRKTKC